MKTLMMVIKELRWMPLVIFSQEKWDGGDPDLKAEDAKYFGGFTQKEVKPSPDSPLLKLGMETVPPLLLARFIRCEAYI